LRFFLHIVLKNSASTNKIIDSGYFEEYVQFFSRRKNE